MASIGTFAIHLRRPNHRTYRHQRLKFASPCRSISAYGYEQAKALVFSKHGEPTDILSLHTHSISPAHSNLVTIRFLASPINPADINQLQGVYPSKPVFSTGLGTPSPIAVGGNEGVAEVIGAGEKVNGLKRGDWVMMKSPSFGTWRTHAQCNENALVKIDDKNGINPIQAGTVSVNPSTAYRLLKDHVRLDQGDWFVQNGANSGVGRAAIQLGKLWGYRSVNVIRHRTDGLEELKLELKSLGADVVITDVELQSSEAKDMAAQWTNGGREKIKLGLNCVGGKPVTAMAKLMAADSHLVTYGAMSKQPMTLPTALLIFKNIHFDGFWLSRWGEQNPEEKKNTVDYILQLYRQGKFKDVPVDEIKWDWDTKAETLIDAVGGTLKGYRKGKGIFVFGKT